MGVRGLKTYIENRNRNDLRSWAFRDKLLIIDGCNLYYTLYFDCNLDQMHGGDYDAFEELITQFFKNLRACDIDPYVVLDGGADHTDKKLDTIRERKQDKINAAFALSVGKKVKVLPILIKSVFRQLLHKLKVPLVQCLEEADWEIAALAEEWNCPVLSNDSDFYIFNLKAGFLPITHFQWQNVKVDRQTNKKYIQAKHFTVKQFCASFNMNTDLLPVFASILGNDYVKLQNIRCLTWAENSQNGIQHDHIDGLLNWLSPFPGPEEAVSALLTRIDDKEKAITQEALSKGIQEYKLFPGSLAKFFHSKTIPHTTCTGLLQVLPQCTLRLLLEGKMSSIIIDAVVHRRVFMVSQVEDFQLPCSSETSRPIRQEPPSVRLQVLLDTLGVSSEMLRGIQPALHLQMLVTYYWLVNAQPQPSQMHLWGLLLGMVHGKFSSTPQGQRDMLLRPKKLQTARRRELRRGITLDSLLVRGSSAERLFNQLKGVVVSLVGEDFIKKMRTGLEYRAAGQTQRDYNGQNQPVDELSSGFEHLMYEDINDSEDDYDFNAKGRKSKGKDHKNEIPDVSYTIRTRHKTKARNANHPSKKYERSCFE
ncbi:hypothetical protein cypCar_00013485 [Cyprinus carpio]|nr:hypothetical protein cypCar_00013485 [Cyprinus carpio]